MRYRYTLSGGYDRQLKAKVEKGALYAVPIAVLLIVGIASLTNNTTVGPGVGSHGTNGQSVQATNNSRSGAMQNAASHGPEQNARTNNNIQKTASPSEASASPSQTAQAGSAPSAVSPASTIQPGMGGDGPVTNTVQNTTTSAIPSTPTVTTSPTTGSGSGGSGTSDPTNCVCSTAQPVTKSLTPVTQPVTNLTQPLTNTVTQTTGGLGL